MIELSIHITTLMNLKNMLSKSSWTQTSKYTLRDSISMKSKIMHDGRNLINIRKEEVVLVVV